MKFPRYWSRGAVTVSDANGHPHTFVAWGWSDRSVDEAKLHGEKRAAGIADRVLLNQRPDRYEYGAVPFREEIIREFRAPGGEIHTVLTINSYGCHVMNTTELMFVDVDLPRIAAWRRLLFTFRKIITPHAPHPRVTIEVQLLKRIDEVATSHPQWSIRIYRTRAGLRYMFLAAAQSPQSEEIMRLMEHLKADPLYIRLCKTQQCFRARLTPKPWRCGVSKPGVRFPWPTQAERDRFTQWNMQYQAAAGKFATCQLLGVYGTMPRDGAASELAGVHDSLTKAGSALPLA